MVEGAEDGDDAIGDGLALLERLPEERRLLRQSLDRPHRGQRSPPPPFFLDLEERMKDAET